MIENIDRRLVVAVNPEGGSYHAFPAYEEQLLAQWPGKYDRLDTSPNRRETAAEIAELVRDDPTAVIINFGGDGTIRGLAIGAVDYNLPNPVVAEWGGTKCNTARAFRGRHSILDVIAHGVEMSVPLLQTTYETPDKTKHIVEAIDDVSFMSAVSVLKAVDGNKVKNRQRSEIGRFVSEAMTTVRSIANHSTFIAQFSDGRQKRLATLIIGDNEFIAGDGRMLVTKADPYQRVIALDRECTLITEARMIGLALGAPGGERWLGAYTFQVLPDERDDNPHFEAVPFAVDGEYRENGEDLQIPFGSEVSVDRAYDRHYKTLITSRKMIRHMRSRRQVIRNLTY